MKTKKRDVYVPKGIYGVNLFVGVLTVLFVFLMPISGISQVNNKNQNKKLNQTYLKTTTVTQTPTPGTVESAVGQQTVFNNTNSRSTDLNTTLAGALSEVYSSTGNYFLSVDGKGSTSSSMTIRVNKPSPTATVQKAILMSTATNGIIDDGCVTLSGSPVNWDGSATKTSSTLTFNNYWSDVTSIVGSQINGFPEGISNLTLTECSTLKIEGEALLVVFNDAGATEKTIIIMFGAATPAGDDFSVTLAEPIDPLQPGALLDMGLGIGFGFQSSTSNQFSEVSVNGQRISSSAGGDDDGGLSLNGALITVGGIGDLNTNPADPFAAPVIASADDELYSILPFITNTNTSLNINTINPSGDDNIFLAYFALSGAAIIGEGVLISQLETFGDTGTNHTVAAVVKNSNGLALPDKIVTFTITSGPNSALVPFSATTDANGEVSFTYTSLAAGSDTIQACFTDSQDELSCSNVLTFQWIAPPPPTISCSANVQVNNAAGLCGATVTYSAATATGTPTPIVTYSHASGSIFPVGLTTVAATATNSNGSSTCEFTVTVADNDLPVITVSNISRCTEEDNLGCSIVLGATASDNCAIVSLTSDAPACFPVGITTVTWTAIDTNGNSATASQIVTRVNSCTTTAAYCTYSQDDYGCAGGRMCDGTNEFTTRQMIAKCLTNAGGTIRVGKPGRSVVMTASSPNSVNCIINKLPGGGPSVELPSGNPNICSLPANYLKRGRIKNALLAQTITLSLNANITNPSALAGFKLQAGTFATAKPQGCCGSIVPATRVCGQYSGCGWVNTVNEYTYRTLAANVVNAITPNANGDRTVAGLIELANRALANADGVIGSENGVSLSSINNAVHLINTAFDGCKIFVGWDILPCSRRTASKMSPSKNEISITAHPNPFIDHVSFEITSDVSGNASLEIFNVLGQRVYAEFNKYIESGLPHTIELDANKLSGTLIYVLTIDGEKVTGKLVKME